MGIIKNFRYRNAFRFGRYEHFISRLLFVFLVITLVVFEFKRYDWVEKLLVIDILLWIIYWSCHRIEKMFHPKH